MSAGSVSYAIACPNCGVGLRVAANDLGQRRNCPECKSAFGLPTQEEAEAAAARKRKEAQQFGFACALCHSRLYARPSQQGHPIKCPDCHAINHVPAPERSSSEDPPTPVQELEAYELLGDESWQSPQAETRVNEEFGFPCRVCETMIYALPTYVGKPTVCPDCSTVVVVPQPPPPTKKVVVKADDPGIQVAPASPRPERETVNVDKLMGEAHAKVLARAKQKPRPPKHPFWSGVFTFPFHWKTVPFLIVFTMLAYLSAVLFEAMLSLTGLAAIVGIFFMILSAILGFIVAILSSNYYVKVVNWTSMGYPNIEANPDFEFLEFVREALFVFNAVGVSGLPGVVVGLTTNNFLLGYLVSLSCGFWLFPFVFLSFLDAETPTMPYSAFVASTFRTVRGGWVKFYLLSAVALSIGVAAQALYLAHADDQLPLSVRRAVPLAVFQVLAIAGSFASQLIYFRLLGRLAYVIERKTVEPVRKQDGRKQDGPPNAAGRRSPAKPRS